MEKRAILAFALSIFVIFVFNYLMAPVQKAKKPEMKEAVVSSDKTTHQEKRSQTAEKTEKELPAEKEVSGQTVDLKGIQDILDQPGKEPQDIRIKTDVLTMILTNRGGRIKGVYMEKYRDKDGKQFNLVRTGPYGELPLSLTFQDPNVTKLANNAVYDIQEKGLVLDKSNPKGQITLEYQSPVGLNIVKTFTFYNDRYGIDIDVQVKGADRYTILWGPGLSNSKEKEDQYNYDGAVALINGNREEYAARKIQEKIIETGEIKWVAIQNKYFLSAMIPKTPISFIVVEKNEVVTDKDKNTAESLSIGIEPNNFKSGGKNSFILYTGPKVDKKLETYGVGLEKVIDFGWFSFLSLPLLVALRFINQIVGNYGFAIIIITVLIKLVFYPLTEKSYTSMQAMQKVQPKMKELQKIYKNDKQRLNSEIMALYKKNKVNPAGGCLPMFVQIPIFIALYEVLLYSIDVRQTDFILWITDLSAKDPYYVMPILMGISMFVQQKMTPSAGDPRFAQVMTFMPIVFTFLFLNFPAGLVIYWLVNNLLTIAQQYLIKKRAAEKEVKA